MNTPDMSKTHKMKTLQKERKNTMPQKWRIVFVLAAVAAVACAIVFFMPKELCALISPDADEFSISSAIVEVSGETNADAVTITDAAVLNELAQALRTANVTYVGLSHSIVLDGITLYSVYPNAPGANKLRAFSVGSNGHVYLDGKEYRLTAGCRDSFVSFFSMHFGGEDDAA